MQYAKIVIFLQIDKQKQYGIMTGFGLRRLQDYEPNLWNYGITDFGYAGQLVYKTTSKAAATCGPTISWSHSLRRSQFHFALCF